MTFTPVDNHCIENYPNSKEKLDQSRTEIGILSFDFIENADDKDRLALIVDGQHRLAGMSEFEEELPVLVVALLDASNDEQAFQFVVVNNKAKSVKTDNVKAIISDIQDENEFQERLSLSGVNYGQIPIILREIDNEGTSPFYHLLNWPLNPDAENLQDQNLPVVSLTTIESCLRYIRNQLPDLSEEKDEDTTKELFLTVWNVIANHYDKLWRTNEKFMSKVNISAINEFILDRIESAWFDGSVDIYDEKDIKDYVLARISDLPAVFWETEWTHPLQDNKVIREMIKEDIKQIVRNKRSRFKTDWYEQLELVGNQE